jgi:tRNA (guanine-N7-)-methyltransferase
MPRDRTDGIRWRKLYLAVQWANVDEKSIQPHKVSGMASLRYSPSSKISLLISQSSHLPKKRHYRQRAHANPFSDHALLYPASPLGIPWESHYPAFSGTGKRPEFADIGCGFGGLLIALAPLYPDTLMLGEPEHYLWHHAAFGVHFMSNARSTTGLEIRVQVSQYVQDRIAALRATSQLSAVAPTSYQNIAVVRANAMKFTPNYFAKHSLSSLFFLFPDPHFKSRKHKARIISPTLLAEYAHVLRPGGIVYTITDVLDLHEWMKSHFRLSPLFAPISEGSLRAQGKGPILDAVFSSTEEGKKVERSHGQKWLACFERVEAKRNV